MEESRIYDKKTVDSLNKRLGTAPAWKLVDMEITSLAWGRSEMVMEIKEKYLNISGICHGGITATFADTVMGTALYSMDVIGPTIEMSINYMAPLRAGQRVTGRGEVLKRGKTTAVIRADMFVDQTMVATARGTYSITEDNNRK